MFVSSFEGDFDQFQSDADAGVNAMKAAGVENLLVDLTDNGGGYVCLGIWLHEYLAGTNFGYA